MNDNNPLLMGVDIKRWSCVILHLVKQLDDVAYAQLLPTRSVPPKRPQLPPRNEIALGGVGLGEMGLHILDEGLGHRHRKVQLFARCREPVLSEKPGGISGGSAVLQIGQRAPAAPQPHATGPSHGRSGCASQIHMQPSHCQQVMRRGPTIIIGKPQKAAVGRTGPAAEGLRNTIPIPAPWFAILDSPVNQSF
jgi:hypothetical protein